MLVLICMLPAGMCTQQTRGSHYCAAVTPSPPPTPRPPSLPETGPCILNKLRANGENDDNNNNNSSETEIACGLTVSLMTPLSAENQEEEEEEDTE